METKHTPEPWMTVKGNGIYLTLSNGDTCSFPIVWSEKAHMDVAYIVPMDDAKHANAARIVACVNALAGFNPDGVRDAVDALRAIIERWDTPLWKDAEPTAAVIAQARAALAKLEDVK